MSSRSALTRHKYDAFTLCMHLLSLSVCLAVYLPLSEEGGKGRGPSISLSSSSPSPSSLSLSQSHTITPTLTRNSLTRFLSLCSMHIFCLHTFYLPQSGASYGSVCSRGRGGKKGGRGRERERGGKRGRERVGRGGGGEAEKERCEVNTDLKPHYDTRLSRTPPHPTLPSIAASKSARVWLVLPLFDHSASRAPPRIGTRFPSIDSSGRCN